MALVKCPDCAGRLSTEAIACPHCGRPNRPADVKSVRPAQQTVVGHNASDAGNAPPPSLPGYMVASAGSAQPAQPPPLTVGQRAATSGQAQPPEAPRQPLPQTSARPASSAQIPKTQQAKPPARKLGTGLWNYLKMQCDLGGGDPGKELGTGLVLGIVFLPYIFAWFTLRKGHSTKQRFLALGWMVLMFFSMRNLNRAAESSSAYTATVQPASYAQPSPVVRQAQDLTYVDETCLEVAEKFGTASGLSDLQMDEAWKPYRGKGFEWELSITEVSSDILGGFSVQAKCSPRSRSLIQDIQILISRAS